MFKETDRQVPLFGAAAMLAAGPRRRLDDSWAPGFQRKILPLLFDAEADFAALYSDAIGRPNWSVARKLGVCILQEMHDLADQDALDALSFDIRWQHALGLSNTGSDAYLSRRSLVKFRSTLAARDPEMKLLRSVFEQVSGDAIADLGLSTSQQRVDSTIVMSNIRTHGRVDLFNKTLRHFLNWLAKAEPDHLKQLSESLRMWFKEERSGWFAKPTPAERRTRLLQLAQWAVEIVETFKECRGISNVEHFRFVVGLVETHCDVQPRKAPKAESADPDHNMAKDSAGREGDPVAAGGEHDRPTPDPTVSEDDPAAPDPNVSGDDAAHPVAARGEDDSTAPDRTVSQDGPTTQDSAVSEDDLAAEPAAVSDDDSDAKTQPINKNDAHMGSDKDGGDKATVALSNEDSDPDASSVTVRKSPKNAGSALQSPFDPDAKYGHKGVGYNVHVSETCNNETAEILTDYGVVLGNETDFNKSIDVLERLQESGVQPDVLFADAGYATTKAIVDAAACGTTLKAPLQTSNLPSNSIGRDAFTLDPETGLVLACPQGHAPVRHGLRATGNSAKPSLHAYFNGDLCRACELSDRCVARGRTNGIKGNFRVELLEILVARDKILTEQQVPAWWRSYRIRGGVEATVSELKRAHGMRRLRVRRLPRVRMAVALKTTACNVKRWLRHASEEDDEGSDVVRRLQASCVALERWFRAMASGMVRGNHHPMVLI